MNDTTTVHTPIPLDHPSGMELVACSCGGFAAVGAQAPEAFFVHVAYHEGEAS